MTTRNRKTYILTEIGDRKVNDAIEKKEPGLRKRVSWLKIETEKSSVALSEDTIRKILNKEGVEESSVNSVFKALGLQGKVGYDWERAIRQDRDRTQNPTISPPTENEQELRSLDFIGRDRDLINLANLRKQYNLVLIKSGAGVGKSTLAREFLQTHFKKVIRIEMGLESGNVTPAEEKVAHILRKYLDEEPSRDFGIDLDILREKLADRANPIGVLIDNLEPALDENYRFREKLRGYDALLAVLGDRDVFSFTLITSRRSLITSRARVHEYLLEGLDITAWQQYFRDCENGAGSDVLVRICVAYNGNAKVMDILHGAIKNRFDGNIGAYWKRYKDALLADSELETLISVEMDWLRDNQPDAYKLLCRMGCYRYQDVKTVPFEGLLCLLWDVPESRRAWAVDYLSRTSLVEIQSEYYLHPAVREATQSILLNDREHRKEINLQAAGFFRSMTSKVKDVEDAILGFEVIYHYLEAKDYAKAASVIFEIEGSSEDDLDNFGYSCWRLGFSQQITSTISTISQSENKINDVHILAGLYRIAGYAQNQLGNIHKAIEHHKHSGYVTYKYLESFVLDKNNSFHFKVSDMVREHFSSLSYKEFDLYNHEMNSVGNIGLLPTSIGIFGNEPIVDMMCAYFINSGLCYMDLWEIGTSIEYLEKGMLVAAISENRYWVEGNCCLALAKSISGALVDAYNIAEEASINYNYKPMTAWGRTYSPLILAKTYKNLGDIEKSFEMYRFAFSIAEEKKYTQAKANVMIGLAEIYRECKKLDLACSHNLEAVSLLIHIGAKCDLAEAYFQLGLTYQAMGEHDQAKEYKAKALELFEQMKAPKQIERVNKAFEQGAIK